MRIRNAMGGPVDLSFDCVGFNKTMTRLLKPPMLVVMYALLD